MSSHSGRAAEAVAQANAACESTLDAYVSWNDPCPCEWEDFEWYGIMGQLVQTARPP